MQSDSIHSDPLPSRTDPDAHYYGTAPEIIDDLAAPSEGASSHLCDLLVAGTGTGGTITGMGRRLKESNPAVVVLGVDPRGSILARPASLNMLKEGESDMYRVEGIGYDFVRQSPVVLAAQTDGRFCPDSGRP